MYKLSKVIYTSNKWQSYESSPVLTTKSKCFKTLKSCDGYYLPDKVEILHQIIFIEIYRIKNDHIFVLLITINIT